MTDPRDVRIAELEHMIRVMRNALESPSAAFLAEIDVLLSASPAGEGPPSLRFFAQKVLDTFERDIQQGYTTKDKQFAVELLSKGLAASPVGEEPKPVDEGWETSCPARDDGQHCNCWYDGKSCCSCGDAAPPPPHKDLVGELLEALEPFALEAEFIDEFNEKMGKPRRSDADWARLHISNTGLTIGDLRRARSALDATLKGEDNAQ